MNNDLFIQYSHSITWDYSKGILPSGRETAWDWEESYIPIEHKQGSRTLGKHEFMRVKVGAQGVWSVPMRIVGLGIKSVSTVLKSSSEGTKTYAIETTYDDGTVTESDSLLTIVDGKDGKDGADANNYDTASEWFNTSLDLQAFTGYSNDQYYGIFENKSIYQYKSGATVGIKPDDITGNGRYVLVSDLTSDFADDSDMDATPMILSTKAVAPSNLQYWWDNIKDDYYTDNEVDNLLDNKVDKETGKGLTSNDFTNTLKSKLDAIAAGAEVNVNADWNATSGDAQILNKPSTFTPSAHNHAISDVTSLQDALDDKLDKSLTSGKIWVGDVSNLPYETYLDGITGIATVGTGGQYPTMKSAIDAGKHDMRQVGDILEDTAFNATSRIRILGNKFYTITITSEPTSTEEIIFDNCNINMNSTGSANFLVNINNSIFNINYATPTFPNLLNTTSNISNSLIVWAVASSNLIVKVNRITNCEINGGSVGNRLHSTISNNITGTFVGNVWFDGDNSSSTNVFLPSATLVVTSSKKTRVSNCSFSSIVGSIRLSNMLAMNVIFSNGGSYIGSILSGSKFVNCSFGTALTIDAGVSFINCTTTGLTLSGTKNTVIGGQHTSIVVNGNSNEVSSCVASTSITLGAVTKCKITNNETSTSIVETLGNTFTGNTLA